jgi:hypothetical protein
MLLSMIRTSLQLVGLPVVPQATATATLGSIGMERGDEPLRLEGQVLAPWFEDFRVFLADGVLPEYSIKIMVYLMISYTELGSYEEIRSFANLYPISDPNLTSAPLIEMVRTRLPLALTLCGLSSLALASFFELPFPYNLMALIAILGPATVTAYGLKKQPN